MKRMLCSALLCFIAFSPAVAQTKNSQTEQEVLKVVDSVLQALVKRDAAALERDLTEDHYTVYDAGQVGDRKLLIDSFKSTTSGWDPFERLKSNVKLAGNAAIALCETKAKRHSPAGRSRPALADHRRAGQRGRTVARGGSSFHANQTSGI